MSKKKTTITIFIIIIVIIIAITLFIQLHNNKSKNNTNEQLTTFFGGAGSFTDRGIIYYGNESVVRFTDIKSKTDVVLCDKPNCEHIGYSSQNPNPTCNATLEGLTSIIGIYNNKIYSLNDIKGEMPVNKGLFVSDLNGANRKQVATVKGVILTLKSQFIDNKLIFSYLNQYDLETFEKIEKSIMGMVIIDLDTYDIVYSSEKEGYNVGSFTNYYSIDKNKLFYEFNYYKEDVWGDFFKSNNDVMLPTDEEMEAFRKQYVSEIYSYDLTNSEEILLYRTEGESPFLITDEKAYFNVEESGDNTGYSHIEYDYVSNSSTIKSYDLNDDYGRILDNDNLILSSRITDEEPDTTIYSLNLKTDKLMKLGSLPYNITFNGVTTDYIYCGVTHDDERGWEHSIGWYYVIDKSALYKGDMTSIFPFRPYNESDMER